MVISQIDTDAPMGKRDYAILLAGVYTGIRAGDVASMRIENFDLQRREFHFVQGKTGKALTISLHENLTSALVDYLLHGRPKSDSPFIFLRCQAPYQRLSDGSSINNVLRRYIAKTDLVRTRGDGRSFHGLRRVLATRMVEKGVPVDTVSQVLGHTGLKATNRYINLDIESLRICVLEPTDLEGGL